LLFIWAQSIVPQSLSRNESLWLTTHVINPILHLLGLTSVEDEAVRKAAHITEFVLLSVFMMQWWKGRLGPVFSGGLIVAFLDESIQLFSGRGAQIQDIWIDLIGVVVGMAVGGLIWAVRNREKRTR